MKEKISSAHITGQKSKLMDWRGILMIRLRKLIRAAAPDAVEEWKWDMSVWSQNGNIVALAAFRNHVKLNFFKGAALEDPQGLFNAGSVGKTMRAIDFRETDEIREGALKELIRAAVTYNLSERRNGYKGKEN
jgi:hypothetical protein